MISVGAVNQQQAFDPKGPGGKLHGFSVARTLIGSLAVNLDRRELRRNLLDVTDETCQRFLDQLISRT